MADAQESLYFIEQEIGPFKKTEGQYPGAYDVGFIYRALYIETGIVSKELVKRLPYETIDKTCSMNMDIEEIIEKLIKEITAE